MFPAQLGLKATALAWLQRPKLSRSPGWAKAINAGFGSALA